MLSIRNFRGKRRLWQASTLLSAMALVVAVSPLGSINANANTAQRNVPFAPKQLIFVSDGMMPDRVERYARSGDMPNYAKIFNSA